jgi:predicted N-acetyltransferase YhbS
MTDGNQDAIRRATPTDRDALLNLIDTAFSPAGGQRRSFAQNLPHLFTDKRIGCHWIYEDDARILGCIGLYPYDFRAGDVTFHAAGVGQVCTSPDARGRGVMSALLQRVCEDADQYDFSYLWGDRLRYGRYGWASGGATMRFETCAKYLPDAPPAEQVRSFDPVDEIPRLQAAMARSPETIVMNDEELGPALRGQGATGWILDESFILANRTGSTVLLGDGDATQISLLLSHAASELGRKDEDEWRVVVECSPEPSPLLEASYKHYRSANRRHAGMFRVGDLAGLLGKLALLRADRISCGTDRLSLIKEETGQAATIDVKHGRAQVTSDATDASVSVNTKALSELCFGICAPDLTVSLAPGSPLRAILPWGLHVSHLFGL